MKRYFSFLLALILMFMFASCAPGTERAGDSSGSQNPEKTAEVKATYKPTTPKPTAEAVVGSDGVTRYIYYDDAVYLIDVAETVHPIFIVEGVLPDNYEELRSNFLNEAKEPLTRIEFRLACMRYMTSWRDFHSSLGYRWNSKFLELDWFLEGDRLYLTEDGETSEVISVGGIPVSAVLETAGKHFYFENEAARIWLAPVLARDIEILRLAGAEIENDSVTLTTEKNGRSSALNATAKTKAFLDAADWGYSAAYVSRHRMIDDIFYIDLRIFTDGPDVEKTVTAIESAVKNGTRHFIIDLRGNPGGNSLVGSKFLDAMGVTPPSYEVVRRMSDLAREQREFDEDDDVYAERLDYARNLHSENPNNVFISVLTDKYSHSSSMMLAVFVQDGGLGNIIGEPSANSPSNFGDILTFSLPRSGLDVNISYTYWQRPDAEADQTTLVPDIPVPAENALEKAVEFLKGLQ